MIDPYPKHFNCRCTCKEVSMSSITAPMKPSSWLRIALITEWVPPSKHIRNEIGYILSFEKTQKECELLRAELLEYIVMYDEDRLPGKPLK